MKIQFGESGLPATGVAVVGVLSGGKATPSAAALDKAMDGGFLRAAKAAHFKGEKDQILSLPAPGGTKLDRAVGLGMGPARKLDAGTLQALGGQIYIALAAAKGATTAAVLVDSLPGCKLSPAAMAAEMALGLRLRSYSFDKYFTKRKKDDMPTLRTVKFLVADPEEARRLFAPLDKVADGVFLTRDLVSEPANVLYPEAMAKQARDELEPLGVEVDILDAKDMRKLGMGSLLGVGQGSVNEPRLVAMQWWGAGKPVAALGKAKGRRKVKAEEGAAQDPRAPLAFVGKGVTFDTGGISIKPSAGMEEMKWDMAGAGAVIGLMKALAGRKARVNVVGIIGLVENMPSGNAQRPGDVVTSMSGQTIEVLNTDAEGRLVLADALWYCKDRFAPRFMVDLATLTGAMVIALGHEMAGLFASDDKLADHLIAAGRAVDERLWRLPLGEEYDKMLKSDIADMKNISGGRSAGSITAAQFLKRFVGDVPWAHLDIAGTAWTNKDRPVVPKGAAGFGVRLLDRLIADHYEAK
ncbi:MAG: leucyl aminopeptidase [Magnetospirillum sp. WYHS-4]